MGQIPVARAQALPGRDAAAATHASPWQTVSRHARDRGDHPAFVVGAPGATTTRTWAEVADGVERAAAGLVRSGLRVDQVVVSLLPADHAFPELDLALRTVGAVVVHIGPHATRDDLARHLGDVQLRLVVAEAADDVDRLEGLSLARSELFTLDGGRGWTRLLELGSERLVMDPTAVERADRVVDHGGSAPRLLAGGVPLGQVPAGALREGVLDAGRVVLALGDAAEPLLQVVREAHLVAGSTLCVVQDVSDLEAAAQVVHPSVLVAPAAAGDAVARVLESQAPAAPTRSRRSRGWRSAGPARTTALRAGSPSGGPLVVAPAVTDAVRARLTELGGVVVVVGDVGLLPPHLPQPPPVVMGDVAQLPRRSRRAPGEEFELRLEAPDQEESAFSLPSLPLMSGESFLDQLLLSRARQARE